MSTLLAPAVILDAAVVELVERIRRLEGLRDACDGPDRDILGDCRDSLRHDLGRRLCPPDATRMAQLMPGDGLS